MTAKALTVFLFVLITMAGCQTKEEEGGIIDAVSGLDARPVNSSCFDPGRPGTAVRISLQRVFPDLNLESPVAMIQGPHSEILWYVIQQEGIVSVFSQEDPSGSFRKFGNITGRVVYRGERGLLGMAFHPRFPDVPEVFLSYTGGEIKKSVSFVSRFQAAKNGLDLKESTEEVVFKVDQPFGNHNGGWIQFGKDGYLYIGLGDGGSRADPYGHGQNIRSVLGALLRLDIDSRKPFAIPPDNPFAKVTGRDEIYAYGFRNPWRWSFDTATGDLWMGDVGQNKYEEVNLVKRGGNYGWNIREGLHCFPEEPCDSSGLIDPVVEYSHQDGCSITGGFVYRGDMIPELSGIYVFGDYCNGNIWGIFSDGDGNPQKKLMLRSGKTISSFAQGWDGEIYLLDYRGGSVFQVVSEDPAGNVSFPAFLSATGCMTPGNPEEGCSCLIPYDINVPFWSDGADKKRWFMVPADRHIRIDDDGNLIFPVGSILVKQFYLNGDPVETRLLIRHQDGEWGGYSYEWNDDLSDAVLLASGKVKTIHNQEWVYPSRSQCLQCHTAAAERVLGPEVAQLNRFFVYESENRRSNQLATYSHIGLFSPALAQPVENLPAFPDLTDTAVPVQDRARTYLHVNCSSCHRPGGNGRGNMDLRFDVPLVDAGICGEIPQLGSMGLADARLIFPVKPAQSVIVHRMSSTDFSRMPPLGSTVVDTAGVTLITQWILSLQSCP